jgi:hypothetical protein
LSFDEALKFDMPDHPRSVIKNHCVDSKYVGFIEFGWNRYDVVAYSISKYGNSTLDESR